MNLKNLIKMCSIICDKHIAKNPNACLTFENNKYLYTDIKKELDNLCGWCFPMETKEIRRCVFCSNCKNYLPGAQAVHNHPNVKVQFICKLDKMPKKPDHYCGYGERND
jgi:hypothetical protein